MLARGCGGGPGWGVTANGYKASFWSGANILELDSTEYTKKTTEFKRVDIMEWSLYLKKKKKKENNILSSVVNLG